MTTSQDALSEDEIKLLRNYARRVTTFLQELNALNEDPGAKRETAIPRTLEQVKSEKNNWKDGERTRSERPETSDEEKLRQKWTDERGGRLLVLGEVGMGKTILAETFAYRLAADLDKKAGMAKTIADLPVVPLIVRLTALEAYQRRLTSLLLHADAEMRSRNDAPAGGTPAAFAIVKPDNPEAWPLWEALFPRLMGYGKLAIILDGFDEMPRGLREDFGSRLANLGDNRLLLTSRPGYGAERLAAFSRDEHHHRLTPVSIDQCRKIIGDQLAGSSSDRTKALAAFDAAQDRPLGAVLQRPLYLRVFCQCIGTVAVGSLGELMAQAYREFPRRRGLLDIVPDDRRETFLKQFSGWFVRLAMSFADDGFNTVSGETFDAWNHAAAHGDDCAAFAAQAVSAGLLCEHQGTYSLPKTPVVEFLIGRHVADLVKLNDAKAFIEVFRRWVWRLDLHDCLDYTFDLLFNPPRHDAADLRSFKESLARGCVDWLLKVVAADPCQNTGRSPRGPARDDLVRSFALLAMQLIRHCPPGEATETAIASCITTAASVIHHAIAVGRQNEVCSDAADVVQAIPAHKTEGNRLIALAGAILARAARVQPPGSPGHADAWAVESAAGRVKEEKAYEAAEAWLTRLRDPKTPEEEREPLAWAVRSAAGRVKEEKAYEAVEAILARLRDPQTPEAEHKPLARAVHSAAERVKEEKAYEAVEAWLTRLRAPKTLEVERWPLARAVESAAGRLKEDEVRAFGERMIEMGRADLCWSRAGRSMSTTLVIGKDGKTLTPRNRYDRLLVLDVTVAPEAIRELLKVERLDAAEQWLEFRCAFDRLMADPKLPEAEHRRLKKLNVPAGASDSDETKRGRWRRSLRETCAKFRYPIEPLGQEADYAVVKEAFINALRDREVLREFLRGCRLPKTKSSRKK